MKIEVWFIGKTSLQWIEQGIKLYFGRLQHYIPIVIQVVPTIKNAGSIPVEQLKMKEAEEILKRLRDDDFLVLLDERGSEMNSRELATFLEQKMNLATRKIILLVGGAFGASDKLTLRANYRLSLSKMTFSHQMIRLFLLEQLYRAMTIIRQEPYHNE
jgi:23S rRNA (pseudouridine1915-N3)-methyltransferase